MFMHLTCRGLGCVMNNSMDKLPWFVNAYASPCPSKSLPAYVEGRGEGNPAFWNEATSTRNGEALVGSSWKACGVDEEEARPPENCQEECAGWSPEGQGQRQYSSWNFYYSKIVGYYRSVTTTMAMTHQLQPHHPI